MQITAKAKFVKISPKKVKPLLKEIRNKSTNEVLDALKYSPHKAGQLVRKLIASAVANAYNNYNLDKDNLKIKSIVADDGPTYKRRWLRSRGSADLILKRTTNLQVVLEEVLPQVKTKTKAKAPAAKKEDDATKSDKPAEIKEKSQPQSQDKTIDKKSQKSKLDVKKIFRRTTNK